MNTDNDFLDREYNPRVQIPRFSEFFGRWKADALEARGSSDVRLDVAYGSAAAETLDLFPAAAATAPSPLLIFIHGGYWRVLDKADFSWVAPPYAAAGISVAVLNYGLVPKTPMSEIVNQIRRACVWLHDNALSLGVDSARIFCSGHSAGGHLTGMMLATDWPVLSPALPKRLLAGALTISGVFDLRPLTHAEFLCKDLGLDENGARAISPAFLPLRNDAPFLTAVGALESSEFHRQSRLIAEHWPTAVAGALLDVPDCNHFSVCDAFATPGNVLFETWRETIRNSSSALRTPDVRGRESR